MEEYLSRRLPALRRLSVLPSVVTSSANTKSTLCSSFPDQAGSFLLLPFPGPRHKRTLSTLQRKYLHIELSPEITKLTQTAPKKSSEQILFRQPGLRIPLPLAT
ncbi:hypothetical protein ATANTOWER_005330 [Ataeniobius toweri]|uniref:Uncharacterized protein n=1 Tax=Ataeniobius toweri TaxID=208326 RepID=A0ABU7A9R4_9TELE|nr:hypothetical protein [Ataeniobius toweri]